MPSEEKRFVYANFDNDSGSGGVLPSNPDVFLRLVDSKVEVGEERMMRRITEMRSELLTIVNARSSRGDVWGVCAVIVGTILATAAIGIGAFDTGIQLQGGVSDAIRGIEDELEETTQEVGALTERSDQHVEMFSQILENLEELNSKPESDVAVGSQ